MNDVLLLNADYRPVQVMGWERAVCLLLADKVRTVAAYTDTFVRSENLELEWPCVVHLVRYARIKSGPRLNRRNVLARDRFECAYCGVRPRTSSGNPDLTALTIDHVAPKSKAVRGHVVLDNGKRVRASSWENLVAACTPCNQQKADRTPEQASMTLLVRPRKPNTADLFRMALTAAPVPEAWLDYL